jgi:hypothetical protein
VFAAVWPDQVGEADTVQPGYYLAAALAGLASGGVVPQQPLTNVEVAGFDDYSRSYKYFNETQLNKLAESGVWIVTARQRRNAVHPARVDDGQPRPESSGRDDPP